MGLSAPFFDPVEPASGLHEARFYTRIGIST
jgi:hypothetical protein